MAKILEMPKLSPTMEEGQLSVWHKKEGDEIAIDDLLAEVETDKATMEFRSFDKGTLLKLLVPAGTVVKLGQPVAIIGKAGEDISSLLSSGGGGSQDNAAEPKADAAQPKPSAEGQKPAGEGQKPAGDGQKPAGEGQKPSAEGQKPSAEGQKPQAEEQKPQAEEQKPQAAQPKADAAATAAEGERVKASPYVRKLAREHDLDLRQVQGSGPAGRIIARDVEDKLHEPTLTPQPPLQLRGEGEEAQKAQQAQGRGAAPDNERERQEGPAGAGKKAPQGPQGAEAKPLSMMRKTIARRLTEAKQTVPHFYLSIDVDAEALSALREQINRELSEGLRPGEEPEKISLNDLIIRACATALRRVPECNAQFGGDVIYYHQRVDISVAVAVPEGLMTPVVRDADRMGVVAIARAVRDLAGRAKAKKLAPEEMSGGTFSVSNLGMFGIDEFAAVINPPEGAILAVGRVRDEPVVKSGAVVPGKRLALTLSCDHRVIDGAVGARFLAELRALIERPMRILAS